MGSYLDSNGQVIASGDSPEVEVRQTGAPTISTFDPSEGAAGTDVEIRGGEFIPGGTKVFFNGIAAPSPTVNPEGTLIMAQVPSDAPPGSAPIEVITEVLLQRETEPIGRVKSAALFTVLPATPVLGSIGPTAQER